MASPALLALPTPLASASRPLGPSSVVLGCPDFAVAYSYPPTGHTTGEARPIVVPRRWPDCTNSQRSNICWLQRFFRTKLPLESVYPHPHEPRPKRRFQHQRALQLVFRRTSVIGGRTRDCSLASWTRRRSRCAI